MKHNTGIIIIFTVLGALFGAAYRKFLTLNHQIRENEKRYRILYENVPLAYQSLDSNGKLLEVNRAWFEMLGYAKEEVAGRPFSDFIAPAQTEIFESSFSMFKKTGACHGVELEMQKKDSTWITVLVEGGAVYDENGRFMQSHCILTDITTQKRLHEQINASLKEKDILLKEVHHRVKNNLQIITSLLSLQARHIKNEDLKKVFSDSEERIKSMALIHEMLYRSENLSQIDISKYVWTMAGSLHKTYKVTSDKVRIRTDIDSIMLRIEDAIPLGLIINELVSNSMQHAFPDDMKGEINITLKSAADNKGFDLTVSDNGIGIDQEIDINKTETLGLRLIVNLVEKQLGGKIELDREKGSSFRIKIKVEG